MSHRLALLLAIGMVSCVENSKLDSKLIGTWTMYKVYEYDKDVTGKHNPQKDRWIEFNSDGSFVSDGEPFGRNTGRWKIDKEQSILFIDSDVDDDDSEWRVTLDKEQMMWTGIGHPRKENTTLIHKRR